MLTPPSESTKENQPADIGGGPGIDSLSTGQEIRKLLHDLRNPLTPLVMGIEILKSGSSDPKQLQLLELMHGQVRQLTGMLDHFQNTATIPPADELVETAPAGGPGRAGNESSEARSVLIIDDNPNILASLQILFEERDYSVLAAMKAEDAIVLADTHKPDLCLCDISLPTLDGFEAAAELRKAHGGMLMFSMSGFDSREDREQSRDVGFLDHFRKPFVFDEVLQIIENFAAAR